MIRPARSNDLPQLKALWMQAFQDDELSADHYFANRHRDENMLVDAEGGQLRAMLTMLPAGLAAGGATVPAVYFFAIATGLAWRGRGISTALIKDAEARCRSRGAAAAVLVPANAGLFDFYGRRGYETRFYYRQETVTPDKLPACPQGHTLLPVSGEALYRLREKSFAKSRLFLRWNIQALDYIIASAAAFGAPLLRFGTDKGEGFAYCERAGEELTVKELALSGIEVPQAVAILDRHLHAASYTLRLAGADGRQSASVPFGMIKAFEPLPAGEGTEPYMSFAKD